LRIVFLPRFPPFPSSGYSLIFSSRDEFIPLPDRFVLVQASLVFGCQGTFFFAHSGDFLAQTLTPPSPSRLHVLILESPLFSFVEVKRVVPLVCSELLAHLVAYPSSTLFTLPRPVVRCLAGFFDLSTWTFPDFGGSLFPF